MKKIVLIFSILISAFVSNAQLLTFKVNPYTFQDGTRKPVTITGIRAKMISNIDCNLSDSTFYRQFYIDFQTTTVDSYGKLNTDTNIMSSELSAKLSISLIMAKDIIKEICRKLEYGTVAEKYAAAGQLAGAYGYTLKPINEQ